LTDGSIFRNSEFISIGKYLQEPLANEILLADIIDALCGSVEILEHKIPAVIHRLIDRYP
jgi:hypothetical protein